MIVSNDGTAATSPKFNSNISAGGQLIASLEVVENSLFHFNFEALLLHSPTATPQLLHANLDQYGNIIGTTIPSKIADGVEELFLKMLEEEARPWNIFPSGMESWIFHTCTFDKSFPTMLLVNRDDVHFLCRSIGVCYDNAHSPIHTISPFPYIETMDKCGCLSFGTDSYQGLYPYLPMSRKVDHVAPLFRSIARRCLNVALPALCFYGTSNNIKSESMKEINRVKALSYQVSPAHDNQCVYCAAIVTKSGEVYSFQWLEAQEFFLFMQNMQCINSGGCLESFRQTKISMVTVITNNKDPTQPDTHKSDDVIIQPCIFDFDRDTKLVKWSYSVTGSSDITSQTKELRTVDINFIQTNCSFNLTKRYLMTIKLDDFKALDISSNSTVLVTAITSDGQCSHSEFASKSLSLDDNNDGQLSVSKYSTLQLYVSDADLLNNSTVLLGVHQYDSVGKSLKTIGERQVTLNALLHHACVHSTHTENGFVHLNIPTKRALPLLLPRNSLMYFYVITILFYTFVKCLIT
jgi:hypothetical protein